MKQKIFGKTAEAQRASRQWEFKKLLGPLTANFAFSKPYALLLLIVLFGLFLRLIFFSGMGISDSLVYSKTANDFNEGRGIDPESTLTLSTRLGLIYPTALSYKLFGINDFSSVLFVLLASIGSIILIFYFGKLLFNEKIGLMAAFLLSFFPLDVVYATKLQSDIPSAFFMALGVYAFLYSEIKKLKHGVGYLLSGISIGIGYLIRESALLIALFFITYVLYKRKIRKEYFLVPLGVLVIFAIEATIFFNLAGDPLFRFSASQQYLADAVAEHNYFGRLDFPAGLFHYPWLFLTNKLLVYFYIPVFMALAYFLVKKRKETHTMAIWIITLLLYLSFGSTSFSQYIPFLAKDRYTAIVTMPSILLLSCLLLEKKLIAKKVASFSLIALLLLSIGTVYLREDRSLLGGLRQVYPELEKLDRAIYIDSRSIYALDYISGFENKLELEEYPEDLGQTKDAYIVINRYMIRNLVEANRNLRFPDEIQNPPKSWKIIKDAGSVEKDKIIIYQIP